jgi:hypothetical protein
VKGLQSSTACRAMSMDFLSLSNCHASKQAWPWKRLEAPSNNPYPNSILYNHEAIATVFEETEWMIITGGIKQDFLQETHQPTPEFHIWLMNLTHADLYGTEAWFQMTSD